MHDAAHAAGDLVTNHVFVLLGSARGGPFVGADALHTLDGDPGKPDSLSLCVPVGAKLFVLQGRSQPVQSPVSATFAREK